MRWFLLRQQLSSGVPKQGGALTAHHVPMGHPAEGTVSQSQTDHTTHGSPPRRGGFKTTSLTGEGPRCAAAQSSGLGSQQAAQSQPQCHQWAPDRCGGTWAAFSAVSACGRPFASRIGSKKHKSSALSSYPFLSQTMEGDRLLLPMCHTAPSHDSGFGL